MVDHDDSSLVPALMLPDAAWKSIQQNTFTRWVNKHLSKAQEHVDNLETDLADGLRLIKLAEVLSHKSVGKHNKKVAFRTQKLENVTVALRFLQDIERIKIVNIDSSHIVDCNRKLILGLIWTLIVHYSISAHMWEGTDEAPTSSEQTPKQRLLAWIRSKLPSDVPVTNFTSDWNDGVALGALVDALAPGPLANWRDWDPDNAVQNTKSAMQLADEDLGVAQLITPEELINPNIDEKSVMTYLAQFPQAKRAIPKGRISALEERPTVGVATDFIVAVPNDLMKPKLTIRDSDGAAIHHTLTKTSPTEYSVKYTPERKGDHEISLFVVNITTGDGRATPDAKATISARLPARLVYSPETRLGEGPITLSIEDAEGATPDDIDVVILPPTGEEERVIVVGAERSPSSFSAAYTPSLVGLHSVNVFERRKPLPGSPFPLRVRAPGDDLRAWGRGLAAAGVVAGEVVEVNVDHLEAYDERGQPIEAKRAKRDLRGVNVGVKIVDNATGIARDAEVRAADADLRAFSYTPPTAGDYIVEVTADGAHVGLSPYHVTVAESVHSRVRAFGPGLEGGVAQLPSVFYVESNGERARLAFAVEGPSQTDIRCEDRGNGSAIVEYTPAIPGVYSVSILAGDEHIKDSPFVLLVDPHNAHLRPSAVRVSGIDERGIYVLGRPIEFEIDTTHAGDTLLIPSVSVLDGKLLPVETTVTQLIASHTTGVESPSSASGLFSCVSLPTHAGQHYINVAVKGVSVPGSPFPVTVVDPSKLRIFGPGVDGPVVTNEPTHFTVDAKQAGPGTLELALNDGDGRAVDIDVLENNDGSFTVKYTAPRPGPYQLKVVFAGEELPKIEINVKPNFDPAGIRVEGLENAVVTVNCEQEVHVFTSNGEKTRITIRAPSGKLLEAIIEPSEKGLRVRFTPPETGNYTIDVTCEDAEEDPLDPLVDAYGGPGPSTSSGATSTRGSPSQQASFHFQAIEEALNRLQEAMDDVANVSPGASRRRRHNSHEAEYVVSATGPPRAELVRVFGPGLGTVPATLDAQVYIDASLAGLGDIDLYVDGPTRTPIHCVDNHNGTCVMNYVPRVAGMYWLRVLFDGRHVTGSPFQIIAVPPLMTGSSTLSDLDSNFSSLFVGQPLRLRVDPQGTPASAKGAEIILVDENGRRGRLFDSKDAAGVLAATYTPDKQGELVVEVLFDGIEIAKKSIRVNEGCDASKVKCTGEGLSKATVDKKSQFQIDTKEAGVGRLHIEITGPDEVPTRIHDNGDGTATVEYTPAKPGLYTLSIMYGNDKVHVPGSPFRALADHPHDTRAVVVRGLEKSVARAGELRRFVIDASKSAEADVAARLPIGQQQPFVVERAHEPRVYDAHFTPVEDVGDETVVSSPAGRKLLPLEVLYGGEHVNGSPFTLTLLPESDPSAIRLVTPQSVAASRDGVILIDKTEAGKIGALEIEVTGPDGRRRRYEITATATEHVDELRFRTDLPGEYFVQVRLAGDESRTVVKKARLTAEAKGVLGDIEIMEFQTSEDGWLIGEDHRIRLRRRVDDANARLAVIETTGKGIEYAVEARKVGENEYEDVIIIRARKAGHHRVVVLYGGIVIKEFEFEALTAEELEAIRIKRTAVIEEVVEVLEKKYYAVDESIQQTSEVEANNNELDTGRLLTTFDERVFPFDFDPKEIDASKLTATVEMPGASTKDSAEIIDNHDGTVLVKYTPKTAGNHVLSIVHDGVLVQGTPISFYVDKYSDGFATVYGPGTQGGVVGETAHFTVCAKHGHAKELSVSIEGPAQANIKIHDNKDGTCSVSWIPPMPGQYQLHVKLAGKEIDQSPFKVLVAGEGSKRAHLSVGSTSEVALNISEKELKGISASIKSPSGIEEPCFVRIIDGGRLGVSFTPREAGEHLITVKRDGKLVPKAPFKIKVDRSQVGDASKVEVTGDGRAKALTQQWNEILIDTTKAGYGGLSVSVQGPSKAELQCKEKKTGLVQVLYKPTEPGVYAIAVKFADHHVLNSPLTVHCTGPSGGAVKQEIEKRIEQASISLPGQETNLFLKLPNTSPMDVVARIMDPKGNTEDVEMRDQGEAFYVIKFKPKVEGAHALSILHRDAHVNGSPFQFTVGSFSEGGAHKVRASGMGVIRGETTSWQSFNLYSREAGAGKLAVAIEGPSKATLKFEDHKDGNCHVDYKVTQPGEYIISVKYNDQHIPDSPFKVFIAPATGEVRKLELASFHDSGIPVGKAFTFMVLTHRARGHLEGKVLTPSGETEQIDIVPIEDGESYAMRIVPKESGNHYIHVTLDGAPMRDSPFRLRVGGKDECDPTAIHASGEGLVGCTTGTKGEFTVATANAGAGILTIQVDGPSKVTLDAYELDTGYKARYTALAPGDYFAAVKYNGIHVPGSPYKIHIDGKVLGGNGYNETAVVKIDAVAKTTKGTVAVAPVYKGDASKVVAKGAGLNKFFPGRPAMFTIDTALAGNNLLMVGIVTTKGPCEEVVVKHQGNGHYICTYRIQDRLKGFVFIKYGDVEIPGSPFSLEF